MGLDLCVRDKEGRTVYYHRISSYKLFGEFRGPERTCRKRATGRIGRDTTKNREPVSRLPWRTLEMEIANRKAGAKPMPLSGREIRC